MKYFISALVISMMFASNANALGKREEGVLIGIGSIWALNALSKDRNRDYDRERYERWVGTGQYGDAYRGDFGQRSRHVQPTEFPPFRCYGDSVQCSYERGLWERERDEWLKDKDAAYRCGRYGEC